MNGKKARKLRAEVYGHENSPRHREYKVKPSGQIMADKLRWTYQQAKKVV